jgi:hypothetical protein
MNAPSNEQRLRISSPAGMLAVIYTNFLDGAGAIRASGKP